VRDARVGEHPLHARLRERQDVPDGHGGGRNHPEQHRPVGVQAAEAVQEHPDERREARRFHGDGHERGDGGGGTLVDVRRPHVERHRRDLEPERDHEHRDAGQQHRARGGGRHRRGDLVEPERPGRSIDERDAVEQESGRERAEQEVLHRRFVRAALRPPRAREHVDADRHHLEAEKNDDEVGRRRHHDHAGDRERDEAVVVAGRDARALEVRHRHQHDEDAGDEEDHREEDAVGVEGERAVERHGLLAGEERGDDGRNREADQGHPPERLVVVDEEAERQQHEAEDRSQSDRQNGEPVDRGQREGRFHHTPPAFFAPRSAGACSAWASAGTARACPFSIRATIAFTDGSIVLRNGAG
jgi:hypothetical protein